LIPMRTEYFDAGENKIGEVVYNIAGNKVTVKNRADNFKTYEYAIKYFPMDDLNFYINFAGLQINSNTNPINVTCFYGERNKSKIDMKISYINEDVLKVLSGNIPVRRFVYFPDIPFGNSYGTEISVIYNNPKVVGKIYIKSKNRTIILSKMEQE
jgi:hypothetical protein